MKKLLSIVLAVLMLFSTVSYAAPVMVDTAVTAEEVVAQETTVAEETVLEAETEKIWKDEEKGVLLYHIDFDNLTASALKTDKNGDSYISSGKDTTFDALGVTNPSFVGKNDWVISSTGAAGGAVSGVVYLATESDGNVYGKMTTNGSTQEYPHFDCYSTSGKIYENGIFTVSYKYKTNPTDSLRNIRKGVQYLVERADEDPSKEDTIKVQTLDTITVTQSDAWQEIEYTFTPVAGTSRKYKGEDGNEYYGKDLSIAQIYTVLYTQKTTKTEVMFDDVKLYWKPYEAKVTIDANGNTDAKNVEYIADTSAKVDLDALKALMSNTDDKMFIGFSLTPDGELIYDDFWVSEDTTIYARWSDYAPEHEQHGKLLMFVDFENIDKNADVYTTDSEGREFLLKNVSWEGAAYFNPAFADLDTANISIWPESSKSYNASPDQHMMLGTEDGNTYASLYAMNNALVMAWIRNDTYTEFYKPGNYTVVYDVNASSNITKLKKWYELGYTPSGTTSRKNCQFINETTVSLAADTWHRDNVSYFPYSIVEGSVSKSGEVCDTLTSFNIGVDVAKGTTVKYDNIRVYYKPVVANITIDANGNSEAQNVVYTADTSAKVDLDALKALMSNTDSRMFLGFSLTPNGEILRDDFWASEDTTIYARWSDADPTHEQHGTLVFVTDFDNINKNSSGYLKDENGNEFLVHTKAIYHSSFVNPDVKDLDSAYVIWKPESCKSYNGSDLQYFLLGSADNNVYGSVYASSGKYVMPWIKNARDTVPELYKKGNYTVVFDVNSSTNITKFMNYAEFGYTDATDKRIRKQEAVTTEASLEKDTWHRDRVVYFPYSLVAQKATEAMPFDTLTGICIGVGVEKGSTVKYDNVRVYWKPVSANITINMNGNNDKTVDAYVNDTSSVLSLDALKKHVGAETANYTLVGFSKTADGELLTADFWANEDMTLYAVWEAKTVVTPESYNVSSIRTSGQTGIRFMSSITKTQKAEVSEYGFIVTLKSLLGDKELTHNCGVSFVSGVNYGVVDEKNVDLIYKEEGDNLFFTAVVYGIPDNAAAYKSAFIVRPYSKRGDYYYYGDKVEKSVLDVAKAIRDGGYTKVTETDKAYVEKILTTCGESVDVPNA